MLIKPSPNEMGSWLDVIQTKVVSKFKQIVSKIENSNLIYIYIYIVLLPYVQLPNLQGIQQGKSKIEWKQSMIIEINLIGIKEKLEMIYYIIYIILLYVEFLTISV